MGEGEVGETGLIARLTRLRAVMGTRVQPAAGSAIASGHTLPHDEGLLALEPGVEPLLACREKGFIQAPDGVIEALPRSEETM
jgi:hypothetical protein